MRNADADLLIALRTDILRGDFSGLESHLAALSGLETGISDGHDAATLAALRTEAERNRRLLAAAAEGVRAALRRVCEAAAPSSVYAPDGRRLTIEGPEASTESRA